MFGDIESPFQCDLLLALFDFFVEKLFHPPAIETYEVIVVRAFIQLENRLAGFKMVAVQ